MKVYNYIYQQRQSMGQHCTTVTKLSLPARPYPLTCLPTYLQPACSLQSSSYSLTTIQQESVWARLPACIKLRGPFPYQPRENCLSATEHLNTRYRDCLFVFFLECVRAGKCSCIVIYVFLIYRF